MKRVIKTKLRLTNKESKELLNYLEDFNKLINETSKMLEPYIKKDLRLVIEHDVMNKHGDLRAYTYNIRDLLLKCPKADHIDFLTDVEKAKIASDFSAICKKHNIPETPQYLKSEIALCVMRQCKALSIRHEKQNIPIVKARKAIRNGNKTIKFEKDKNGLIQINIHNKFKYPIDILNKCYESKFGTSYNEKTDKELPKLDYGGNLVYNKGIFMYLATIDVKFEPKYTPIDALAIDLNMKSDNWVYMSDGTHIKKIPALESLLERQKKLLVLTNKKKSLEIRSKKRSLYWKQLYNSNNKINKSVTDTAQAIIDKAVNMKAVLCIDNVSTGASNGEWGQALRTKLVELCENQGVPFVLTPTPYTSQRCSSCGYIERKNRKGDEFVCLKCKFKCHADLNAAYNIKEAGFELYQTGKSPSWQGKPF